MPKVINFFSPTVLQLMKRIEIENDQEKLAQLLGKLNLVLNQNDHEGRRPKKRARSTGLVHQRRRA